MLPDDIDDNYLGTFGGEEGRGRKGSLTDLQPHGRGGGGGGGGGGIR